MRLALVALALVLVLPASAAEVVGSQWNDSNTVQLPGGPDPYPGDTTPPPEGGGGGSGSSDSAGGGTLFGGDETVNAGSGSSSGGSGSGSTDFIIFGAPQSGSGSGTGGSSDDTVSLLGALVESGAVSGSTSSGVSSGGHDLDGSGGVFISGAKVRAALQGKGALRVTLRAFGLKSGSFSNSDLSLIGASAMLKNPALESAFISLSRFDITYRSQGYLFAVVPVTFPVRVSVNPAEPTLAARVSVRFPWYSFFLRKFVAKDGLARDVDAIIVKDTDPSVDRSQLQAKIFSDVSIMLQGRVDTVEGSVRT